MPTPQKYTAYRVLKWLEAGNTGTARQISEAIGSQERSAHLALEQLEARGQVWKVRRSAAGQVWALRSAEDCGPLVQRAIKRRTPIELAWAHPAPRPSMESLT